MDVCRLPFTVYRLLRQQTDVEAGCLTGAHVDVDGKGLKSWLLDAHAMRAFSQLNDEPVLRLRAAPRFPVDGDSRIAGLHAQRERAHARASGAIPVAWRRCPAAGMRGSACAVPVAALVLLPASADRACSGSCASIPGCSRCSAGTCGVRDDRRRFRAGRG